MSSKFFIYASGCWREIELDTGCVSGWGRPNFVYMREGRLVMAQRRQVMRALRLLAAGRVSAVTDGAILSKYETPQAQTFKRRTESPVYHHTLTNLVNQRACTQCNDERFNKILKETSSVGTQCITTADASNQVSDNIMSPQINNKVNLPGGYPLRKNGRFIKSKRTKVIEPKKNHTENITTKRDQKRIKNTENLNKRKTTKNNNRQEVKELIIGDEIVEILHRYLKKNNLGFDVKRYAIDDAYKAEVFYKINPLVVVEQCPQIMRMLQGSRTEDVSEKDFMTSLGLQSNVNRSSEGYNSTSRSSSQSMIQENKENELQNNRSLRKRTKDLKYSEFKKRKSSVKAKQISPQKIREVILLSSNSDSDFQDSQLSRSAHVGPRVKWPRGTASPAKVPNGATALNTKETRGNTAPNTKETRDTTSSITKATNGTAVPSTKAPRGKGRWESRGYSPAEDQAIIAWVQRGGRARLVNGNRLWRELQHHHFDTTGVSRSFHSLRNRYLRYILPSLPTLASTPVAMQLRSAAATGEIKNRNKKAVNNSMFALPRVNSAWAPRRAHLANSPTPASPARAAKLKASAILTKTSPNKSRTGLPRVAKHAKTKSTAREIVPGNSSTSSGSRSPSPVPRGSSTPSEVQLDTKHNVRDKSRLSKRYSEMKRRFRDVEESSDEAPRVRPRASAGSRRSNMDDSARELRHEPKKRRLYNPQVF